MPARVFTFGVNITL